MWETNAVFFYFGGAEDVLSYLVEYLVEYQVLKAKKKKRTVEK